MVKCCIKGCQSEKYPGYAETFHGFPSDEKLKEKWREITKVTGSVKYKRICSLHFKNDDFIVKGNAVRLKRNVVPTFLSQPFKRDEYLNEMLTSSKDFIDRNVDQEKLLGNTYTTTGLDVDSNDNSSLDLQAVREKMKQLAVMSRCTCCLGSSKLQSLWQERHRRGHVEIYGTMLVECFALPWKRPENTMTSSDLICESCISRLKDAVSFKTEVLASHQLLSVELESVDIDKLKKERDYIDTNVSIDAEYPYYEASDDVCEDKNNDSEVDDNCDNDNDNDGTVNDDVNFDGLKASDKEESNESDKEIMIKLEPYPILECKSNTSKKRSVQSRRKVLETLRKKQSSDVVKKTRNSVRRRDKSNKQKLSRKSIIDVLKDEHIYSRKFTTKGGIANLENVADNLRNSVIAVKSNKMTETEACNAYKVPLELIVKERSQITKINQEKLEDSMDKNSVTNGVFFVDIPKTIDDEKDDIIKELVQVIDEHSKSNLSQFKDEQLEININNNKLGENRLTEMKQQANNIAIILEFSNATPIRRHGGIGYGCCFCNEEYPDAADLKAHTMKEHDVKTKRNFAKGKRPSAYLVKLDITGLKCNLCGNPIDSLEHLYDHLIEVHKKLLYRSAKNYIVPFKFDQEELRCLFCEFICNSFKGLLEHMSVHYRNHVCEVCDAGFLTKNNLFNHAGRHKKGTFKCDYCTKVFDTSSKRAGHQRLVHSTSKGVNRCGYCGEMFRTYRRKEKHLINIHGIVLKKLKCKACDKTFETQTGLRIHTKRDHLIERRFECSVCDKRCFTNVQLKQHTLKHTGIKKFKCMICMKAYGRKSTLREHMRIHDNDRRFKCDLCGMAFVQKCSWRGHMLSKHGQQV